MGLRLFETLIVSIQPKPKDGLEGLYIYLKRVNLRVSIQPKPKDGLEAVILLSEMSSLLKFQFSRSRRMV